MIKLTLIYCLEIWILVFIIGCGNHTEKLPDGHEITVKTAPDGLSKAFVWLPDLGGFGATVSQPYQVWMQKGEEQKVLIFEADKTGGVHLAWKARNELEICYERAQITHFRNFFVVAEPDLPQIYKVEIVLRKVQKLGDC